MRDLSNELTVFVIACEKGDNYKACLKALENQSVSCTIKYILDVYPMNEAFNEMIYQCETPYFIQVDEDMILESIAVETLYDTIKQTSFNVASIYFKLQDIYLNEIIGSLTVYRYSILKNFKWKNIVACDNELKHELYKKGYSIQIKNKVLGKHHPYWTPETIFKRFCNKAQKETLFDIKPDCLKKLFFNTTSNFSKLNLFAFLGYVNGIITASKRKNERNYSTYENKNFKKLENAFDKLNIYADDLSFISPTKNLILEDLARLINIKFEEDIEKIKDSNLPIFMWNPYSYVVNNSHMWKKDLVDFCRDNNRVLYTIERGSLPNTLIIDKKGFLFNSESFNEERWNKHINKTKQHRTEVWLEHFKQDKTTLEPQTINTKLQKEQFLGFLNIPSEKEIVFIPLQVSNDTVIKLWSDWVENQENFYNIINTLANRFPEKIFLVKNHPVQIGKNQALFMPQKDNIVLADNVHYKDCIAYCDSVITINSSVGLQASIWNKPVYILGRAFYESPYFNNKVSSLDELMEKLQYKNFNLSYKHVIRFFYYLVYKYYSICSLEKTGVNSVKIKSIEKLIFESPFSNKPIVIYPENTKTKILKLQNLRVKFWLLGESCVDVVKNHTWDFSTLYIGVENEETKKIILNHVPDITIQIDKNRKTKLFKLENITCLVPKPVLVYLNKYKKDDDV